MIKYIGKNSLLFNLKTQIMVHFEINLYFIKWNFYFNELNGSFYQTFYTNKAQFLDPLLESGMYLFLYK